jgi:glucosamine kinase
MSITLLADSGATKTEWCLLRPGHSPTRYRTDGLSPYFQTEAQLTDTLRTQLLPQLPPNVPTQPLSVAFYGTGCTGPDPNSRVEAAIRAVLPQAQAVAVASDMLGAARGVAGNVPGIVCILGTGANACYYDGAQITSPSYALGFWLGDEGSGGNLGKRLVTTYLHGLLPEPIQTAFATRYPLDRLAVLDNAYNKPAISPALRPS